MSNHEFNRTFKTNLLGLSLRSGIMPALTLALLAGHAGAQDSGGFGLLAALKNQSKASSAQAQDDTFPADAYSGDPAMAGYDAQSDPYTQGNAPMGQDAKAKREADLKDLAGAVEVSDYDLVDLHVNNEDLGNILQLLSIQSQRNIISSNNVKATVTADLYGVTFYEALDSILHVNGYGYIEKGNFIYVYTAEELAQFEAANRKPITRIIDLDYLNATDAAEFAKMLLSETGSITSNAATEAFSLTDGVPAGADNYASSATMVVSDFEENVNEIQALIAELDTKPAQILVEATILQTTLNEANAFGMDFALIQNLDFSDFVGTGGPLSIVDGLINGQGEDISGAKVGVPNGHGTGVQSTVGNTAGGSAGLKAGFVNGDVGVFLRVLDEVTDVTVVSNPKLLTLNRQPARVLVGTRVGYLNSTTTDTSTTQSVEFLDVGTQLSVRPFVSKKGLIRLELRPQVSNFTLRQVSDGSGNNVTIPDEDTTEMSTNVMVHDGQTVVLGGLFTETTSTTRRQVPVLGDIPIVGSAFKGYDDSTRRSEIIFLITPSIVNDTVLAEAGDMGNQYIEHARYGARKGLLPWSRERRVGQLLISARQMADDGQIEEALSKVDRALRLMPQSPDARALRSELTGALRTLPSRSLIEGMLHNELHYGGKSSSLKVPAEINPFVQVDPKKGAGAQGQTQAQTPTETFDPGSDADYQPDPAIEATPYVQVPTDSVSDASSAFESPLEDQGDNQFAMTSQDQSGTSLEGEGAAQAAPATGTGVESTLASNEAATIDSYDQMKAVVTGQQTGVVGPVAAGTTGTAGEMLATGPGQDQSVNPTGQQGQTPIDQESVTTVAVADGFSGQLIIPLPGGGALRLNWPLGFDYVVSDDAPQATFTEVPTDGNDFADFTE